ncbi:hypothetical protein [Rhodovibrio sodomensis]|nr:hypothetical protein [Rhodovibrio sodomensis]
MLATAVAAPVGGGADDGDPGMSCAETAERRLAQVRDFYHRGALLGASLEACQEVPSFARDLIARMTAPFDGAVPDTDIAAFRRVYETGVREMRDYSRCDNITEERVEIIMKGKRASAGLMDVAEAKRCPPLGRTQVDQAIRQAR